MKAMVYGKYGSPFKIFNLVELEKPLPEDDGVLVKIQAASINFGDKALVKGEPFLVRLMGYGLLKPKHAIPGGDIAGRVEAVGKNVRQLHSSTKI